MLPGHPHDCHRHLSLIGSHGVFPEPTITQPVAVYNRAMGFNTIDILVIAFGVTRSLFVGLWMVVLLSPLRGRHPLVPGKYLFVWGIMAAFWVGGVFLPAEARLSFVPVVVPEPLNLLLFLAVGGMLALWQAAAIVLPRRSTR